LKSPVPQDKNMVNQSQTCAAEPFIGALKNKLFLLLGPSAFLCLSIRYVNVLRPNKAPPHPRPFATFSGVSALGLKRTSNALLNPLGTTSRSSPSQCISASDLGREIFYGQHFPGSEPSEIQHFKFENLSSALSQSRPVWVSVHDSVYAQAGLVSCYSLRCSQEKCYPVRHFSPVLIREFWAISSSSPLKAPSSLRGTANLLGYSPLATSRSSEKPGPGRTPDERGGFRVCFLG
jgi:hypothetical protein